LGWCAHTHPLLAFHTLVCCALYLRRGDVAATSCAAPAADTASTRRYLGCDSTSTAHTSNAIGPAQCSILSLHTGESFAAKVVAKSTLEKERARAKILTEIRIHRSVTNRHVVRFVRCFEDAANVYIIMAWEGGG